MLHTPHLGFELAPPSPLLPIPHFCLLLSICVISEWKNISDLLFPKYVNQSNNSNSLTLLFILNEQKSFTTVIDNTLYKISFILINT